MMRQRLSTAVVIARWRAIVLTDRLVNRACDVAGRLAGYCMASCWQHDAATYLPGDSAVRCWRRRGHGTGTHLCRRGGTVLRWDTGGRPKRTTPGWAFFFALTGADGHYAEPPRWARHRRVMPAAHVRRIEQVAVQKLRGGGV
jgi:hypothetical protein